MPIYSNIMPEDFYPRPADVSAPLRSTIGIGPRGPMGHSITAEVIDTDPYGYFRIQFKDVETDEVLAVTPNLDVGSRFYACDKVFDVAQGDTCTANVTDFTTMQASSDRSAVRVGDLVLFRNSTSDTDFLTLDTFGIGIVTTVTNNVVTFVVHDVITAQLRDGAITTDMLADLCVTTAKIANEAIVTGKLADDAVTTAKIANLNVTTGKLAQSAVTSEKVADGAVGTAKLADNAVTTAKVTNGAVTEQKIADDAVTANKIKEDNVVTEHLQDTAVTTAKIADANVTTAKIANANVTTDKLATASVTTAKLDDGSVTSAKLADGAVTDAKLASNAVTTTKIASEAVTDAKLASNGLKQKVATQTDTLRKIYPFVGISFPVNQPSFSLSGTSIVVTFPNNVLPMRIYYMENGGGWTVHTSACPAMSEPITVPHNNLLVYTMISGSEGFRVVPYNDRMSLQNLEFVCFVNMSGKLIGPWEPLWNYAELRNKSDLQVQQNIIMSGALLLSIADVYGTTYNPVITRDGTNIVVNIDKAAGQVIALRGFKVSDNGATAEIVMNTTSTGEPIVVPHNSCLICDLTIPEGETTAVGFTVTSVYNIPLNDKNKILCFFNSAGNVVGPWKVYDAMSKTDVVSDRVTALENGSKVVPSYYDSYLPDKIDTINDAFSEGESVLAFAFVTDIHYERNSGKSGTLLRKLHETCALDYVFLGGDYIDEEPSKAAALSLINRSVSMFDGDWYTYRCMGNHEYNNPGNSEEKRAQELTATNLQHTLLSGAKNVIDYQAESCNHIVRDAVRNACYIMLGCTLTSAVDNTAVNYLAQALYDKIPNGANIVVFAHRFLNSQGAVVTNATRMASAIDAYNARSTWENTYDYSGATGKVLLVMCGHMHIDLDATTSGGVPIIATVSDARTSEAGYTREDGTVTEQAFDVVAVNPTTKTIKLTRIGAGSDRTFTWS